MVLSVRTVVASLLIVFALSAGIPPASASGVAHPPQNVTVEAGPTPIGSATVSWVPPAFDGGSPITHYIVWAVDGGHEEQIARVDAGTHSVVIENEIPLPGPQHLAVSAVNANGDGQHAYACFVWSPYGPAQGLVWC